MTREQKRAAKELDHRIESALNRALSGHQIPIMDLGKIRPEMLRLAAGGESLESRRGRREGGHHLNPTRHLNRTKEPWNSP